MDMDVQTAAAMEERCRLCGEAGMNQFKRGSVPLLRCRSCDAVYLENLPTPQALGAYYEDGYLLNEDNDSTNEVRRLGKISEHVKLALALKAMKPTPATLLDIGCDKGLFLDEARRAGFTVRGVELSRRARAYAARIGIETEADLFAVTDRFDVVTMHHSLEHFPDPAAAIAKVRTLLNPGGVLMVRVPDFGCLSSTLRGEHWTWFVPKEHYFHFTQASLRALLERNGFRVETLRSQRPNNWLTMTSEALAERIFAKYAKAKGPSLRFRLTQAAEIVTGVELYSLSVLDA